MDEVITVSRQEFFVEGMHCAACELFVESKIKSIDGVNNVRAKLDGQSLTLESAEELNADDLTKLVAEGGYRVIHQKIKHEIAWADFQIALPLALFLVLLFVLLEKAGIVTLVSSNGGKLSYVAIFIIGIIASLSTCMAVVGGVVLTMAATYSRVKAKFLPHVMFHASRLISFFVLGGVIGFIGSNLKLNTLTNLILEIIIAFVMLILAIVLLDILPFARKLQPHTPKFISHKILNLQNVTHILGPILLGALTFVLPCGFTQSMQIYALGTGSYIDGALTMLVFALGTFPALAGISLLSNKFAQSKYKGIFFKTAAIVIIFLSLTQLIAAVSIYI